MANVVFARGQPQPRSVLVRRLGHQHGGVRGEKSVPGTARLGQLRQGDLKLQWFMNVDYTISVTEYISYMYIYTVYCSLMRYKYDTLILKNHLFTEMF